MFYRYILPCYDFAFQGTLFILLVKIKSNFVSFTPLQIVTNSLEQIMIRAFFKLIQLTNTEYDPTRPKTPQI